MIRLPTFLSAISLLAAPALAQTSAPAPPQLKLSLEQRAALRCSAAFALGAGMQQAGKDKGWPPLGERGREFFVRVAAQLMDETGLTREAVGELVQAEVRELVAGGNLDKAMPACLMMLDGSGL